jgi:lipopolysaccharide biosynthesis glycosyltransferase
MHARLSGDFVSFNAGILVLDLGRMRSDGFSEHFAGMAGRYGLNDQDVLCCYAGTEAMPLDGRWNSFPTRETVPPDARLVHFAGGAKPWQTLPIPAKDLWLAARDRWLARTGAAPEPDRTTTFSGNYVVDPDAADDDGLLADADDVAPAWSRA